MTLIADEQIYDDIPVKKEVKATVSGLYITGVRGLRGPLEKPVKKKKGFRAKLQEKYNEANAQLKESKSGSSRKKEIMCLQEKTGKGLSSPSEDKPFSFHADSITLFHKS